MTRSRAGSAEDGRRAGKSWGRGVVETYAAAPRAIRPKPTGWGAPG